MSDDGAREDALFDEIRDVFGDEVESIEGSFGDAVDAHISIGRVHITVQMDGGEYLASVDEGRWCRGETVDGAVGACFDDYQDQLEVRWHRVRSSIDLIEGEEVEDE